jgi:hypothetical protein
MSGTQQSVSNISMSMSRRPSRRILLGGTGAVGDYLHRIVITVATAATSLVQIVDGGATHTVLPNEVGEGIGVYNVEINAASKNGAWKITTGAGSEVLAVGIFSA